MGIYIHTYVHPHTRFNIIPCIMWWGLHLPHKMIVKYFNWNFKMKLNSLEDIIRLWGGGKTLDQESRNWSILGLPPSQFCDFEKLLRAWSCSLSCSPLTVYIAQEYSVVCAMKSVSFLILGNNIELQYQQILVSMKFIVQPTLYLCNKKN